MNSHQRRKMRRMYERAFGTHVCYWIEVPIRKEETMTVNALNLKIIGKIEETQSDGSTRITHVWFDPETNKAYDHSDGQWVEITDITPQVQAMIDVEVKTMPVLKLTSPNYPDSIMYLDTTKGIQDQIEFFLGEDEVWKDNGAGELTITIVRMDKAEFAALEPLEI